MFNDATTVKNLLNDPILKLIVLERPKEVLDCDFERPAGYDKNKHFKVDDLARIVLKKFKKEVVKVRRNKYVSFKNVEPVGGECLFDEHEQAAIETKLQAYIQLKRAATPEALPEQEIVA
jgi:hypothetical protein